MKVLGIDLGAKGAICKMNNSLEVEYLRPMPTLGTKYSPKDTFNLIKELNEKGNVFAFMEKVSAFPGQSSKSMFSYGQHVGGIEMILIALNIPYEMVPPKTWQKTMFSGTEAKQNPKVRALASASRLAPTFDFKASERSKNPHDGMIDAYLIATFGIRKFAVS